MQFFVYAVIVATDLSYNYAIALLLIQTLGCPIRHKVPWHDFVSICWSSIPFTKSKVGLPHQWLILILQAHVKHNRSSLDVSDLWRNFVVALSLLNMIPCAKEMPRVHRSGSTYNLSTTLMIIGVTRPGLCNYDSSQDDKDVTRAGCPQSVARKKNNLTGLEKGTMARSLDREWLDDWIVQSTIWLLRKTWKDRHNAALWV